MINVFLAGIFGSLGSVCLKIALSLPAAVTNLGTYSEMVTRVWFIGLAIIFNVLMWLCFTFYLRKSKQTGVAVAMNGASSSITTAIMGVLIFREQYNQSWWVGMGLIVLGSALLASSQFEGERSLKKD